MFSVRSSLILGERRIQVFMRGVVYAIYSAINQIEHFTMG